MSRTTRALLCLALALPMSLGGTATLAQADPYPLGSALSLTEMAGTAVAADAGITATFAANGGLSGSGGCNTYSATWSSPDGAALSIGPIAPTFKACDPAVDALENQYFGLLQGAASWSLDGTLVTVSSWTGSTLVYDTAAEASPIVGDWLLQTFGGTPVPDGIVATASFGADGTLTGSGGCNTYSGTYTANDTSLTISRLSTTSMFCEAAGEIEPAYLDMLQAATGWSVVGDNLTIESTYPLGFVRGTAPAPTATASLEPASSMEPGSSGAPAGSIVGSWQMTEFGGSPLPRNILDVSITFAEGGTLTGNGGCHDYAGDWSLVQSTFTMTNVVPETGGTCDAAKEQVEITWFGVVPFLDTAEVTDGQLTLSSAQSGGIGFTFVPAD